VRRADRSESAEVGGVRGRDQVAVGREQDERRVDHVVTSAQRQKTSGSAPERGVEGNDLDSGEQSGKHDLAGPVAPDLPDDAAVGHRDSAGPSLGL
jgi:hypothetical protein